MPVRQKNLIYTQETLQVARNLLGMKIVTKNRGQITSGMIVEVEAYDGRCDEACHCYFRRTPRNEVMFWEAGHVYVYQIYGMHHCVNIVTEEKDIGAAVLIRALEPIDGKEIIKKRRKIEKERDLLRGPGRLCQGLAIDKKMLGEHIQHSTRIWLEPLQSFPDKEVEQSSRIGISRSTDLQWRFYLRNNRFVS